MNIAILDCFSTNYKEIFRITSPSKKKYCEKYSFDFSVFNFDLKDRTHHWGRILGLKEVLPKYDYVLYLDTDTIILDYNFDLRNFILSCGDFQIVTGPLPNEGHIGTNGMIFKSTEWNMSFLDFWYEQRQFIDGNYHGSPSCGTGDDSGFSAPPSTWKFYEQSAFHFLYDNFLGVRSSTKLVPRRFFHSVPKTLKKGDFLIHVPGFHKSKKIKSLKHFAYRSL
jgi:hypothetical protein